MDVYELGFVIEVYRSFSYPYSRGGVPRGHIRAFSPAAIVTLSNRIRRSGRVIMGRREMDASLLIGAPLGLGILLALGILMVAMSYLSQ
jgi:hypothetical protein